MRRDLEDENRGLLSMTFEYPKQSFTPEQMEQKIAFKINIEYTVNNPISGLRFSNAYNSELKLWQNFLFNENKVCFSLQAKSYDVL